MTQIQSIAPILSIAAICELLEISPREFRRRRSAGYFDGDGPRLVEILPRCGHPRFSGEPFRVWLSAENQRRLARKELRDFAPVVRAEMRAS